MSDTSTITIDIDARIEEIKKLRDEGKKADGLKKLETLMNELNDFSTIGRQNRDNRLIINAMRAIAKVTREIPRGSLEEAKEGCFSPSDAGDVEIEGFLEEDKDNIVLTVEGSTKKLCIDRSVITKNLVKENLVRVCKDGTSGFRFIDNKYEKDGETKDAGSKDLYFKMKTIGVFESAIVPMKQVIGYLFADKETKEFKLKKVDDDQVLMLSYGLTLGAEDFDVVDQINTLIYDEQLTTEELPVNLQELLEATSAVSAAHCQPGQEATRWSLARSDGTDFDYEAAANSLMEEGKEFHNVDKYDNSGFDISEYSPGTPDYPYDPSSPAGPPQLDNEINVDNYVQCAFYDYFKRDGGYESYMLRLTGEPESAKDKMYHIFGVDYTEGIWGDDVGWSDLSEGLQDDAFYEMLVAETNERYASNASLRNKTLDALSSSRSRIAEILVEIKRDIESKFQTYHDDIMELYPEDTEERYDFLYNIFDDLELDLDCDVLEEDDEAAQQLGNMFDDVAEDSGPMSESELETEPETEKYVFTCGFANTFDTYGYFDQKWKEETGESMAPIFEKTKAIMGEKWARKYVKQEEVADFDSWRDQIMSKETYKAYLLEHINKQYADKPEAMEKLKKDIEDNEDDVLGETLYFIVNEINDMVQDGNDGELNVYDNFGDMMRDIIVRDCAVIGDDYELDEDENMPWVMASTQEPSSISSASSSDSSDSSDSSAASTPRSIASARTVTPESSSPVNFPSPSTFSGGKKKKKQTKKKKKKKKQTRRVKFNLKNNKYYTISRRNKKKKRKTRSRK